MEMNANRIIMSCIVSLLEGEDGLIFEDAAVRLRCRRTSLHSAMRFSRPSSSSPHDASKIAIKLSSVNKK
jgi:hypothetical protein